MALLDVGMATLANQASGYLNTGQVPQRQGNSHPSLAPYQDFPTLDGPMLLAIGNDGQFARFCEAAGHPEWAADERYASNTRRVRHREVLVEAMSGATRTRTTAQWITLLQDKAVPCGPINDLAQAFDDEQVKARGLVISQPREVFDATVAAISGTTPAAEVSERGLVRLCMLALTQPLRYMEKNLPGLRSVSLAYASLPDASFGALKKNALGTIEEELRDDVLYQAFHRVFLAGRETIRSAREFEQRLATNKSRLAAQANMLCEQLSAIFVEHHAVQKKLAALPTGCYLESRTDIECQLSHLLFRGFVRLVPIEKFADYPRYLRAIGLRLEKLREAPQRDFDLALDVEALWHNYTKRRTASGSNAAMEDYRWLLEELRVSLFAQQLRTPIPVSLKRLSKLWDEIAKAK